MGTKYYVLTAPPDAHEFYSNLSVFSWDPFLNDILIGFGVQPNRTNVMWQDAPVKTAVNPTGKCLIHLTQDLYRQFLLPGPKFHSLTMKYHTALNQLTSWKTLAARFGPTFTPDKLCVSLYDLCACIMIDSTQLSLFDPILFTIDPTMTDKMRFFTDELWKLMYPSPFVETRKVKAIRQEYTEAFRKYLRLPKDQRAGEGELITTLIDQYYELGLHEDDSAAMLVMVYWAGDANAYKLSFWLLAYILMDPKLYTQIRSETAPAVQDENVDLRYLVEDCHQLKSVYYEVLRLTKMDPAFRNLESDMHVGGKLLRKGNLAIVPVCQLHTNEVVYGNDADRFLPDRFLDDPKLPNNQSYRPFGSGRTYCPGRFFAMQEIFGLVAVMLNRLDIRLADSSQTFPVADESLLTLGIYRPLPGSDLLVTLSNGVKLD